jgi:hypothetical protein
LAGNLDSGSASIARLWYLRLVAVSLDILFYFLLRTHRLAGRSLMRACGSGWKNGKKYGIRLGKPSVQSIMGKWAILICGCTGRVPCWINPAFGGARYDFLGLLIQYSELFRCALALSANTSMSYNSTVLTRTASPHSPHLAK